MLVYVGKAARRYVPSLGFVLLTEQTPQRILELAKAANIEGVIEQQAEPTFPDVVQEETQPEIIVESQNENNDEQSTISS